MLVKKSKNYVLFILKKSISLRVFLSFYEEIISDGNLKK